MTVVALFPLVEILKSCRVSKLCKTVFRDTIQSMIKLIAQMYARTEVTEHATESEALDRVLDIALARRCRIDGDSTTGQFIPLTRDGQDDPYCTFNFGAYRIESVA